MDAAGQEQHSPSKVKDGEHAPSVFFTEWMFSVRRKKSFYQLLSFRNAQHNTDGTPKASKVLLHGLSDHLDLHYLHLILFVPNI